MRKLRPNRIQTLCNMRIREHERFLKALTACLGSDASATAVIRRAVLRFGSETPDNIACAEQLRMTTNRDSRLRKSHRGLALRHRRWLVSDILCEAEGCRIPNRVKKRFHGITKKEWEAVQRLATLVFIAMETKE